MCWAFFPHFDSSNDIFTRTPKLCSVVIWMELSSSRMFECNIARNKTVVSVWMNRLCRIDCKTVEHSNRMRTPNGSPFEESNVQMSWGKLIRWQQSTENVLLRAKHTLIDDRTCTYIHSFADPTAAPYLHSNIWILYIIRWRSTWDKKFLHFAIGR